MSNQPLLSKEDKATLLAFQETYNTKTLIIALLYRETAGCHCDQCYARYLRVMAGKLDPHGEPRLALLYDGTYKEVGPTLREVH